ncbi:hypothetical protein C8024_17635 [Sphingopyxis sp. BSNA05]|nr:hypothetical protein [Sphingopyxis sp. BSNA05]
MPALAYSAAGKARKLNGARKGIRALAIFQRIVGDVNRRRRPEENGQSALCRPVFRSGSDEYPALKTAKFLRRSIAVDLGTLLS